jgi:hypothetical protein
MNMNRIYRNAFTDYKHALRFAEAGRSPWKHGRPYRSFGRLYLGKDEDNQTVISFWVHDVQVCTMTPDNIVTFTATPAQIRSVGPSLAGSFSSMLPALFVNFATGRYKLWSKELPMQEGRHAYTDWRRLRSEGQEYFQHLRLDIVNGVIVNTKDMTPTVDNDKRKQWTRNLKAYRYRLRVMARLGTFDNMQRERTWWDKDSIHMLAEAVMKLDVSPDIMQMLVNQTSSWKYKDMPRGEAVLQVFNSAVQTHSREMRLHLGVLVNQD